MTADLYGVIPPLATPMTTDGQINVEALRSEIRYVIKAGVHGLILAGSTGEGDKLTVEETCLLAHVAVEEVGNTIPIVMGIIQDSTRAVIEYGRALKAQGGIYGIQVTPSHYARGETEAGTLTYYAEVGEGVQLPIIVYNVIRWNMIDVGTLMKLGSQEWVVAVKQSAGEIVKLADLLQRVHETQSDLRVLTAIDPLVLPSLLMGAHGTVASTPTLLPNLTVALWNAWQAGDIARAVEIHERMLPVILGYQATQTDRRSRVKALLEVQGRHMGPPRHPEMPVDADLLKEFQHLVETSGEMTIANPSQTGGM